MLPNASPSTSGDRPIASAVRSRGRGRAKHSDINILGFAAKSIARMLLPYSIEITQALANGIRGYKNKVRLRGLTKIKGFETCVVRVAQRKRDRQVSFV